MRNERTHTLRKQKPNTTHPHLWSGAVLRIMLVLVRARTQVYISDHKQEQI